MTTSAPHDHAADEGPDRDDDLAYRSLVDGIGAIVWEADVGAVPGRATFTFVSEGTETLLGYPAERWLQDPAFWFEITHPDDRHGVNEHIAAAARTGEGADFEFRATAADGREVWLRNIVQPGGRARLRGVVVDVTDRRAAEERLQRLQLLTGALSEFLSAREVAETVAVQGRAAVGASAVAVFLHVDDELEIAGYDGYELSDVEPYCRIPLDTPVPAAEVARTGVPLFLTGAEADARFPRLAGGRRLAGTGQFAAIPLNADGRLLGSLAVRMPGERPIEEADRVVLDVLARACSQALLRAAHVKGERSARRSAEDANALLDTIIDTAPEGFALFDRDLRYVRVNDALARINGVPAEEHVGRTLAEIVPDVPDEGHLEPLRRVLETGEPVVDLEVTGSTPADASRLSTWLVSYYPVRGADGEIAWLGAFLVDITERKRAEERAALLAELGTILDEVVGVEERLARLVESLVPRLADTVTVHLHTVERRLERVAVKHVDPELEPAIAALEGPDDIATAMETLVLDEMEGGILDALGVPAADRETHERMAHRSAALIPLVVRERRIGVLALGSQRPHAFGPAELELAEEVARRAALAVDNARLYESERMARERTTRLHAISAALSEALTAADVAAAILSEVVPAVGADRASVWQLGEDEMSLQPIGWRGIDDDLMAEYPQISLRESVPVTDALRSRKAIWLESREAYGAAYPSRVEEIVRAGSAASAAVPLVSAGRAIGAITLSFNAARSFGDEEKILLAALAAQCAQALERARLFETERHVAATLQRSLLPARLPEIDGVEIAVRYLPAAGLGAGGDFYEALPLPDGSVGIAVGDVVGRGASAAATMGQLRSALRAFALGGEGPADVLGRLSGFATTVDGAMAATAVFAKLDPATGDLCYACAGHTWPAVVGPDGQAGFLKGGRGVPLGCVANPQFAEEATRLEPGSTLLLYTDGLTERRGEDVAAVYDRLLAALSACHTLGLERMLDDLVDEVGADAPLDDVALVAIRRPPVKPGPMRLRIEATPEQVAVARAALRQWLTDVGAPAEAAGDVLLAAGEAVANAVEHAYRDGTIGEVELEFGQPEPGVVEISVRDRGAWKEPIPSEHRGRGFGLMRVLMQDVVVDQSDQGTKVSMRRLISLRAGVLDVLGPPPAAASGCAVMAAFGVAHLRGELDLATAADVQARLLDEAPDGPLTVDLADVTYLDSAGARMLLMIHERLAGRLIVVAPEGSAPRRALTLSGLADLLDLRG